jgi:hypothetical protein
MDLFAHQTSTDTGLGLAYILDAMNKMGLVQALTELSLLGETDLLTSEMNVMVGDIQKPLAEAQPWRK